MKTIFQRYKEYLLRHHPFLYKFSFHVPILFAAAGSTLIFILLSILPAKMLLAGSSAMVLYHTTMWASILAFAIWILKINRINKQYAGMGALLQLFLGYPIVVLLFFSPLFIYHKTINAKFQVAPTLESLERDIVALKGILEEKYQIDTDSFDAIKNIAWKHNSDLDSNDTSAEVRIARINKAYNINLEADMKQDRNHLPKMFGSLYTICSKAGNDISLVILFIFVLQLLLIVPYKAIFRLLIYAVPLLFMIALLEPDSQDGLPIIFSEDMSINDSIGTLIFSGIAMVYIIYLLYTFIASFFVKKNTKSDVHKLHILAFIIVASLGTTYWYVSDLENLQPLFIAYLISSAILLVFAYQIRRLHSLPLTDERSFLPQFQENFLFKASNKLARNYPLIWSVNVPTFLVYLVALNLTLIGLILAIQQYTLVRFSIFVPIALLVNLFLVFSYINSLRHFSFKKFLINIRFHEYLSYLLIIVIVASVALFSTSFMLQSGYLGKLLIKQTDKRELLQEIKEDLILFSAADKVVNRNNLVVTQYAADVIKENKISIDSLKAHYPIEQVVLNYQARPRFVESGILGISGVDTLLGTYGTRVFIDSIRPFSYLNILGIKKGFIVEKLGNRKIDAFKQLSFEISKYSTGDTILFGYQAIDTASQWHYKEVHVVLNNQSGTYVFPEQIKANQTLFFQQVYMAISQKYGSPLACSLANLEENNAYPADTNYYKKRLRTINAMCAFHNVFEASPDQVTPENSGSSMDDLKYIVKNMLTALFACLLLIMLLVHAASFNKMNTILYYILAIGATTVYSIGIDTSIEFFKKDILLDVIILAFHLAIFSLIPFIRSNNLAVFLFFINHFTFSLYIITKIIELFETRPSMALLLIFFFQVFYYSLMLYLTNILLHRPNDIKSRLRL